MTRLMKHAKLLAMSTRTPLDDLTEKQREFVREFAKLGKARGTRQEAARRAGYEGDNLDVVAWDLMRKPKIQAALEYQIRLNVLEHAPMAISGIIEIAQDDRTNFKGDLVTPASTRLAALDKVAALAGFSPVSKSEQKIEVNDNRPQSVLEAQKQIAAFLESRATSLDPALKEKAKALLAPPIEAEFTEVLDFDRPI